MKAVILAGGRGTRLGALTEKLPKPLIPLAGLATIEHQLMLLKRYGVDEVFILSGYLAGEISCAIGDGVPFGLHVEHVIEKEPLGTAGAIAQLDGRLTEDFIVLYGDVMMDMDLRRLMDFHLAKKSVCTPVLHPNDHPQDSDLVETDAGRRIVAVHPKPHQPGVWYKNLANTGVYAFSPEIFKFIEHGVKQDFAKNILPRVSQKGLAYGYVTPEYIKDMGTPERLAKVEKDFMGGVVAGRNLQRKRKAVFLDRDGVINRERGLVSRPEDFELLPGAAKAVRDINRLGFLAVVVTNQPVIARNMCTLETLETIHRKMETLLGAEGAYLDAVYFCPHHPDKGYPEENPDYKTDCACRKPKTGMIDSAVKDLNIELKGSYLVGDSQRDIDCAKNAGLTAILVGGGKVRGADLSCADLPAAVGLIAQREHK
jgi:histidinol-phosphate phosphatase family protein